VIFIILNYKLIHLKRKIIPYNKKLVPLAKKLRQNMTLAEIILWQEINQKKLGYDFDRQRPIDEFIVDFYCKELFLAIEVDGITHYNEEANQKDLIREQRLNELGVFVLRFDDEMVLKDINNVVRSIQFWIEEHTKSNIRPTPK
jgi:very-short-patch-repair endonuclease